MGNMEETTSRVLSQGYPHVPFDVWGVWGVKLPNILCEEEASNIFISMEGVGKIAKLMLIPWW